MLPRLAVIPCVCQGCMNNVTLGNAHMGYYETVAGGAGAGPGWHGRSGVHSHMTNTRITDPEILESRCEVWAGLGGGVGRGSQPGAEPGRLCGAIGLRRYPVILRRFELRPGSGGRGRYRGGDGVVRELMFREEALLSVLTERRAFRPYGLHGEHFPRSPSTGPFSPPAPPPARFPSIFSLPPG